MHFDCFVMPSKSITDYFRLLQAPLHNQRWSWGALRASDQALFLRVWSDEYLRRNKVNFYRLTANEVFKDRQDNPGWVERQSHLALIRDGKRTAPTYMVICIAEDPKGDPRSIADYDNSSVFVGGDLIEENGDFWLEARSRISADQARIIRPCP